LLVATVSEGQGDVGERVVRAFLDLWDSGPVRGASFSGLLRIAAGDPAAAALLRGYVGETLAGALAEALGVTDAPGRVAAVGAQLMGIGVARYVLALEPLASAPPAAVAAELGWVVTGLLTGPRGQQAGHRGEPGGPEARHRREPHGGRGGRR
jgi:hypothetical protein